ncbi:calcium-binding protein [Novosphingobium cyanobacteriorum]|uniref:Calcium-binding protein n=1 Tax=Novosphingobium cyanobacteriorum TaxID=3024215 RepID=A0ABT6CI24_9SPHN|nr:calcium-binding protein [Novosphingobium cyanobacteriorum]MDF8333566.1 calcium-binding protein [Novosphingobium cyanobacteriorum]
MPVNTIIDDDNPHVLTGTADDDAIYGFGGNDTLIGLAGDDLLDGGTGADVMAGGTGDDTYVVDSKNDSVTELSGEGLDTVQSSVSWVLGANVENLVLTGSGTISGTGNALDNIITGNAAANVLTGDGGSDWLDGGAGTDTLVGGQGNDTYVVDSLGDTVTELTGAGQDTVRSSITWTLGANVENLVLTGSGDPDGIGNGDSNRITGNAGDNLLSGMDGNDTLDGGVGVDTLAGAAGNDSYVLDNPLDTIVEFAGDGTDTVRASFTYELGDTLENLVLTGADTIDGTGNAQDNLITGNTAANHLVGLDGNDTLDGGGGGGDVLAGGAGDDTYILDDASDAVIENAGDGTDTVVAAFSTTIAADIENLTLSGTASIDGTGNALANVLTGNAGINRLAGGAGDDTYIVGNAADIVVEDAGAGMDTVRSTFSWTLAASVENLVLTGTAVIDATGNSAANVIQGNDAANVIDGKGGADAMSGGNGDDTYIVDALGDTATEVLNGGADTVYASVSFSLSDNVENLTLTGNGAINATGNASANRILGNEAANMIEGGKGFDTMDGGQGGDIYLFSSFRDHLGNEIKDSGTSGTDEVRVTATGKGAFTVGGSEVGIDRIVIGTGTGAVADTTGTDEIRVSAARAANAMVIIGNAGSNRIGGSAFADTIDGGAGTDLMGGGAGDDIYHVDSSGDKVTESKSGGQDTVYATATFKLGTNIEVLVLQGGADIGGTGNTGNDTIEGNTGANLIDGGKGDDMLRGNDGDDTLIGNRGNDHLEGGAGADALSGGLGSDTLTGGFGADAFRFDAKIDPSVGADLITDFHAAEGDRIELSLAQFRGLGAAFGPITADQFWSGNGVTQAHDASDRLIYDTATGTLYYDADGAGGRATSIAIAQLGDMAFPNISASDIWVV